MAIGCVRTEWTGISGGTGVTQLFMRTAFDSAWDVADANTATAAVRTFFAAIAGQINTDITTLTSPIVDVYDETTGELTASVTASTLPLSVPGTNISAYSMASGAKLTFNTGVIRFGRRVRGCMYIVPIGTTAYSSDGTIAAAARTTINTAGANLLSALVAGDLTLVVYSRPQTVPEFRPGAFSDVSGAETNLKVAVLRGRRD